MLHSARLVWFEHAYDRLRVAVVPEAPPGATLTLAPIARKNTVGFCTFDVMRDHGQGFGGEHLLTLHPIQGQELILMLATLVHEMIHAALPPEAKHGKEFVALAKRVGLLKPWKATTPDLPLEHTLRGVLLDLEHDLGYVPVGHFEPKPPKTADRAKRAAARLRCQCPTPRVLTVPAKKLDEGGIACSVCSAPFRPLPAVLTPGDLLPAE